MANYNLVVDTSSFKPYDFSTALALLRDIRDAHYRTDEQINKIQEELGKYTLPEGTKYSDLQNRFWEDFKLASLNFYENGNRDTMNAIRNMRRRYNQEMVPIREMVNKYNERQDALAKLGPDAIVANSDTLNNVESYYGGLNPKMDYRSRSGIQSTAAKLMLGIDNALMLLPELASLIAGLYFVFKLQGIDGKLAILRILGSHPLLNNQQGLQGVGLIVLALDTLYNQVKFQDEAPENSLIWDSIVTGSIMGILAPRYTMLTDHSYLNDTLREALKEAQTDFRFKYKHDNMGNVIYDEYGYPVFNEDYLKSISKGSRSGGTSVNKEDLKDLIERAGGFLPNGAHKLAEEVSTEVISSSKVPEIRIKQYPDAVKWIASKDKNGEIIGYYPVLLVRKITASDGTIVGTKRVNNSSSDNGGNDDNDDNDDNDINAH